MNVFFKFNQTRPGGQNYMMLGMMAMLSAAPSMCHSHVFLRVFALKDSGNLSLLDKQGELACLKNMAAQH